jgi:hypothetical protein
MAKPLGHRCADGVDSELFSEKEAKILVDNEMRQAMVRLTCRLHLVFGGSPVDAGALLGLPPKFSSVRNQESLPVPLCI